MTFDISGILSAIDLPDSGRVNLNKRAVSLRNVPFPFSSAIALHNDAEHMSREAFEDFYGFVNGSGPTPYGDGLGLEIGCSFRLIASPAVPSLAAFRRGWFGLTLPRTADHRRIVDLAADGWIDTVCAHHGEVSRGALERMVAAGIRPTILMDIGPDFLSRLHQKRDIADWALLSEAGIRFMASPEVGQRIKFGNHIDYRVRAKLLHALTHYDWDRVALKLFGAAATPANLIDCFNRLYIEYNANGSTPMPLVNAFRSRLRPSHSTLPFQLTSAGMDALEKAGGVAIVATQLGVSSLIGRSEERDKLTPVEPPVVDYHLFHCLKEIAARHADKRLLVATTARLLHYIWVRDKLKWRVEPTKDSWTVIIEGVDEGGKQRPVSDTDLNGLSFLVPEDAPPLEFLINEDRAPLSMKREADSLPQFHAVYRDWEPLKWPAAAS